MTCKQTALIRQQLSVAFYVQAHFGFKYIADTEETEFHPESVSSFPWFLIDGSEGARKGFNELFQRTNGNLVDGDTLAVRQYIEFKANSAIVESVSAMEMDEGYEIQRLDDKQIKQINDACQAAPAITTLDQYAELVRSLIYLTDSNAVINSEFATQAFNDELLPEEAAASWFTDSSD